MTRTLITGAAGFTGRYLAAVLAERGDEVHAIVRDPGAAIEGVACTYELDLADFGQVVPVLEQVRPDRVVHLAAIAFVAHEDLEELYRSNIVGSRALLEALSRLTDRPGSVLLASSANVYGNGSDGTVEETAPLCPANDYAISKVAMENVAACYRDRLPIIVARPFNYTGRGQSEQFIIPKMVAHARHRADVIELGSLDVARDFSDVRTVAEVYARLLAEPEAIGGTYNVCSGSARTLGDVLELVWGISGHRFDVRESAALMRANEVRILQGSKAKLEAVLGTIQGIPLEETISWMLRD